MAKARGPERRAGPWVRSGIWLIIAWSCASPKPSTRIGVVRQSRARPRLGRAGALAGGEYDRAAGVGYQAAVEQVEGIGDPARGQDVLDGDRVAEHRLRV